MCISNSDLIKIVKLKMILLLIIKCKWVCIVIVILLVVSQGSVSEVLVFITEASELGQPGCTNATDTIFVEECGTPFVCAESGELPETIVQAPTEGCIKAGVIVTACNLCGKEIS